MESEAMKDTCTIELLIRLGGKSHGLNTRQATPASKSRFPVKQGGGQGPIFWLSHDNAPAASSGRVCMRRMRETRMRAKGDAWACVGMHGNWKKDAQERKAQDR